MITPSLLFTIEASLASPASEVDLLAAETELGFALPPDHRLFLSCSDGLLAHDLLRIYSTRDLASRNASFRIREFRPGWLLIGDDSGGRGVLLHLSRTPSQVYLSDLGSLPIVTEEDIQAESLEAWLRDGLLPSWLEDESE